MASWPTVIIKRGDLDAEIEVRRFTIRIDIRIWLGLRIIKLGSWIAGLHYVFVDETEGEDK